jgi:anti-sigma regulatory factor (Ser/Thr protein kinase)
LSGRRERTFVGAARSAADARSFAQDVMGNLVDRSVPPSFCADVELVVSELVTNAVRAGSACVLVTVEHIDGQVVVRVVDGAGGWPRQRIAGVTDVGGRGLALVDALSARWGVRALADGKVVWAELQVPAA